MKQIKIENAIGTVLSHDMTRIIPGKFKGVGFRKGHRITERDIPDLLKIGKRNVFVMELSEDELHEDDAALRIAPAISGANLEWTDPKEGKSNINSKCRGLLTINPEGLREINKIGDLIVSTLRTGTPVQKGKTVAATRIIPLKTQKERIERLESIATIWAPVLEIKPFKSMRFGGVVTGSEIYEGLIEDGFDEFVAAKAVKYGCEYVKKILTPDDPKKIATAINELRNLGCNLILTTGGLSVDPDDVTRMGIRKAGAELVSYGGPILPGAMFLYARIGGAIILGLPACVYYFPTTVYDLMLARVLAGEKITADIIADMGHGGLCQNCPECRYPDCAFGR
jgi:probable molybdopterin binding protein